MDFGETILPFFKEHIVALILCVIGVVCVGYGMISISHQESDSHDAQFQSFATVSPKEIPISPTGKPITVDVEGAVAKPGVYGLPQNSRVQDALLAAGGMSSSADKKVVAQNLNLAAPLADGAKLYIPAVGEQMMTSGDSSNNTTEVKGSSTGMVNINQASEEALDALPGIGPVSAQKIIDNRPYQNPQDLLTKKVVGASEFEKIKSMISVY